MYFFRQHPTYSQTIRVAIAPDQRARLKRRCYRGRFVEPVVYRGERRGLSSRDEPSVVPVAVRAWVVGSGGVTRDERAVGWVSTRFGVRQLPDGWETVGQTLERTYVLDVERPEWDTPEAEVSATSGTLRGALAWLSSGAGWHRPHLPSRLGGGLLQLAQKAGMNSTAECVVEFRKWHTGYGPTSRSHYEWQLLLGTGVWPTIDVTVGLDAPVVAAVFGSSGQLQVRTDGALLTATAVS
jgi:hypothetical protein